MGDKLGGINGKLEGLREDMRQHRNEMRDGFARVTARIHDIAKDGV